MRSSLTTLSYNSNPTLSTLSLPSLLNFLLQHIPPSHIIRLLPVSSTWIPPPHHQGVRPIGQRFWSLVGHCISNAWNST